MTHPAQEITGADLEKAHRKALTHLLARMSAGGFWRGRLSSSALSTALAVFSLSLADADGDSELVSSGLTWLAGNANADGGFGDTPQSPSNLSTSLLVLSAFACADKSEAHRETVSALGGWIAQRTGTLEPATIAGEMIAAYGNDRTFSAPILTVCALAGILGDAPGCWRLVPQLPFALAALPRRLFKWLGLQVVSYAVPALIAIGLARHRLAWSRQTRSKQTRSRQTKSGQARSKNTLRGGSLLSRAGGLLEGRLLGILARMQPENGGFLEATPLTSFVLSGLAASSLSGHPVAVKAQGFLRASVREDGSWPVDTNLSTWLTTLSVKALASSPGAEPPLASLQSKTLASWLIAQQHTRLHPFTNAAPGGWAWTDLPGGVPDADDTAGALVALKLLGADADEVHDTVKLGVGWLLGLVNRDGGVATFCRGWGKLPFDRSCPDITAHALLAFALWRDELDNRMQRRIDRATDKALRYLARTMREGGSWVPLWFGSQVAPRSQNPVYGTAQVVCALGHRQLAHRPEARSLARAGAKWLARAQNDDGSWGAAPSVPGTIEETALAVSALAGLGAPFDEAAHSGGRWLLAATDSCEDFPQSPIGLYFARLWYSEDLYPVIFTVEALGRLASGAL